MFPLGRDRSAFHFPYVNFRVCHQQSILLSKLGGLASCTRLYAKNKRHSNGTDSDAYVHIRYEHKNLPQIDGDDDVTGRPAGE